MTPTLTTTIAALLTAGQVIEMDCGDLVTVTQVVEYGEMSEYFDCVLILGIDVETGQYTRSLRVYWWQEIVTFSEN